MSALAAQCLLAMRGKSATFDEPFYISAGYAYLQEARFELNHEHPPLMKYLIALPLLIQDIKPLEEFADWRHAPEKRMAFGAAFLFENRTGPDALLFWSRVPVLALSLATAVLVWHWARRLYGTAAAVVSLTLYCLCPNIVAHSGLATLDLGVTAGMFAATYGLWRWSLHPTLARTVVAGTAVAAALLMKFSAVAVLGVVPLAWFAAISMRPNHRREIKRSRDRGNPGSNVQRATPMLAGVLLIAALLVAVAYGPRHFGLADYASGFKLGVLEREQLTQEGYHSFCWGRYSATGFWYYHFAAFVIKTPVPVLLLLAATVVRWAKIVKSGAPRGAPLGAAASSPDSVGRFGELFLAVPMALTLLLTMPIQKNFGLRNVLPVYPFLYVLAGGTAAWLWGERRGLPPPFSAGAGVVPSGARLTKARGSLPGSVLVAVLALWSTVSAVRIHPDQLSYFNELVGGPSQGIRYLDDSNIDWGQDLKRLAAFVRERNIQGLKLAYFASYFLKPAAKAYGLEHASMDYSAIKHPGPGWYAVSAHLLQRPKLLRSSDLRFDWLDRFKPEAIIGHSIYVYHFE